MFLFPNFVSRTEQDSARKKSWTQKFTLRLSGLVARVRVRMRVCVRARMCVRVWVCTYTHVYTQAYIRARQLAHSRTRIRIHTCARRLLATAPCTLHPEGLRETARAGPARGSHDLRQNLSFRNLGQSPHTPPTTSTPPPNTRGRSPNPHPPPPPTRFNRGKGGGSGKYEERRCETVALTLAGFANILPTFFLSFFG